MCVGLFVEDRSRRYVCGVDVCVGGCLARKCKEGMCVGVVGVCVSRWCGQVGVRVRVRGACGCAFRGSVWKQVALRVFMYVYAIILFARQATMW